MRLENGVIIKIYLRGLQFGVQINDICFIKNTVNVLQCKIDLSKRNLSIVI